MQPSETRTITDEDLDAIEARAAAASIGPWKVEPWPHRSRPDIQVQMVMTPSGCLWNDFNGLNDAADGEFVAACRDDVPALVQEVRRLRRSRQDARVRAVAEKLLSDYSSEYANEFTWEEFRGQAAALLAVADAVSS